MVSVVTSVVVPPLVESVPLSLLWDSVIHPKVAVRNQLTGDSTTTRKTGTESSHGSGNGGSDYYDSTHTDESTVYGTTQQAAC